MKKISLSFLALAVFLWAGQALATPVVDGTFNTTEWAGHYTNDDGVGEHGSVGPGFGGQAYDVEYTGLQFNANRLYFGLQTGFDLEHGTAAYRPGDFALDINNDGVFEYAIDYTISGDDANYTLYTVKDWNPTAISAWENEYFEVNSGKPVYSWTQRDAFGSGYMRDHENGYSYVLEGSLNVSYFDALGPEVTLQWTMGCGNDVGLVTSSADPVPEPATMLLFGIGLMGMAAFCRKRKKSEK